METFKKNYKRKIGGLMGKDISKKVDMDKEKCGHYGEYGYADGYFGGKYCRIDQCPDAVDCSKLMKEKISDHGGDYVLAMLSNRERGEKDKENENNQQNAAHKPGAKEIDGEEKPPIADDKLAETKEKEPEKPEVADNKTEEGTTR